MQHIKISLFVFIVVLFSTSCIKDNENERVIDYITINSPVPSFTVEDRSGNIFSSAQFSGKQSLLIFFGTYCSDCKRVLPVMEKVWQELKDDPQFLLVAISRDETADQISAYWEENRFTMPFYLDPARGDVFSLFANYTIPRIYLISPENKVTWMAVESLNISADELIQKIKNLSLLNLKVNKQ